ncbi:N-acetyltransferase family protein [Enterococcus saccharolyticus]|uniref:GNAT family N-acetyltransferase n=1 Tax=Enterococcus saccharolyticus TaxID=41997 RepID=UPI0039E179B2
MTIFVRAYQYGDIEAMQQIWNEVVHEGIAFPQEQPLSLDEAKTFFKEQTYTGVAVEGETVVGLYILHPNNIGRCQHIGNTSYAVSNQHRGKKIGETLVKDSIIQAAAHHFRILQFNAVVATNHSAIHLYKKLGFTQLGTIPGGFRLPDGTYADIHPFYIEV